MKKWSAFLMEKGNLIFGTLLFLVLFRVAFLFGNLPVEYFYMTMNILLFLLVIYLWLSFPFYQKKLSEQEEIKALREEKALFEAEVTSRNKELEEYFLLWIHQIKTPITVSKLLLEQGEMKEEGELRTQVYYIEQYTDMAMSYLKLTKPQTDMDIILLSLDDVIKTVLKKYSYLFFQKNIHLSYYSFEKQVLSDAKWLSVLIEQILSNALKYTEKGSIHIFFSEEKNCLVIEDSGIGIRKEDIPKIFDKGYSGFNGRLNQKSSGLGLFLAKKIAKRLNIAISVESEVGVGSRFYLQFLESEG